MTSELVVHFKYIHGHQFFKTLKEHLLSVINKELKLHGFALVSNLQLENNANRLQFNENIIHNRGVIQHTQLHLQTLAGEIRNLNNLGQQLKQVNEKLTPLKNGLKNAKRQKN